MDKYLDPETYSKFDPAPEIVTALLVIFVLIVLAIIIGILAKKADPLKRPKGLLLLAEWAVEKLDGFVKDTMGEGFENFGGILMGIIPFLFLSFTIGVVGLPTPMNNLAVPLSLALVTFGLIHYTSMRYTKLAYFKRYIEPLPLFLPINLLSMWAPLLSLTLRMFGNGLVGWVLLTIVNTALKSLSGLLFGFLGAEASQYLLIPIVTPVLHAYFDLVSGVIQTLVFVFLTALFIAQEKPDEIEQEAILASRKEMEAK